MPSYPRVKIDNFALLKGRSERIINKMKNESEKRVAKKLIAEGWTVFKRGWPDFIAFKDGEIRFVEVKRHRGARLAPMQQLIADLLRHHFGIVVELLVPDVEVERGGSRKKSMNDRHLGCNPRAMGKNLRALGTNPRAMREKSAGVGGSVVVEVDSGSDFPV